MPRARRSTSRLPNAPRPAKVRIYASVSPEVKAGLEQLAADEHRSLSSVCTIAILSYLINHHQQKGSTP